MTNLVNSEHFLPFTPGWSLLTFVLRVDQVAGLAKGSRLNRWHEIEIKNTVQASFGKLKRQTCVACFPLTKGFLRGGSNLDLHLSFRCSIFILKIS